MRRLIDLLLTTEPVQRVRLSQALLAMLLMAAGVVAMHYFVWVGVAPEQPVWWWTVLSFAGIVLAFGLIRSGWSRRLPDPSLAVPQMLYAITSGAVAYTIVGAGRGGVFPIVMVILMFGLFAATPRQMRWVSLYAVALFGVVMALMAWRRPGPYPPRVELGHFIMVATMMPAVSILAGRLSVMRQRMRAQRVELKQALARIQELATRDTLTGLINRRHMQELLEQERQRSVRSGHVFCLAVIDIDRFKLLNAAHGHAAGDEVLFAFAREALAAIRLSDILSRWGGAKFVLMLSDSRSALARGGVERLRERVGAMRVAVAGKELAIQVSAGLTEHRAGESVADALERADRALYEAKAQGRDRVVVA
ncbi:MAG TPA: diguanylate cyclase [Rubrivivax sp.]